MVQLDSSTIESMRNLNKNTDWKKIRSDWILPMLKELNDIYDEKLDPADCDVDFKAEYLSKIKAYGRLETIVSKIDYYAPKEERDSLLESFE